MELNREIFDIDDDEPSSAPALPEVEVLEAPEVEDSKKTDEDEEIIQVLEDANSIITSKDDLNKEQSEPEPEVKTKNAKHSKKYSVRNLLEKVRQKLNNTKQFWRSRSRSSNASRAQSQGPPGGPPPEINLEPPVKAEKEIASQSSPNTPAQLRKEKRTRSFSPVRSFLNSPLIRRRKKNSMDSTASTSGGNATADKTENIDENNVGALSKLLADSDSEDENVGTSGSTSGGTGSQNKEFNYHNLETFQKKKLKQKLKSLTTASSSGSTSTSTTGPYPSPPPAPVGC